MQKSIYLSSTYFDLPLKREAAALAAERLDFQVIGQEDFVGLYDKPAELCLADVEISDCYLGIIAWRYGSIPDSYNMSFTHLEYLKAVEVGIPRIIFMLRPNEKWPRKNYDQNLNLVRYFRKQLREENDINWFGPNDNFCALVYTKLQSMTLLIEERLRYNARLRSKSLEEISFFPKATKSEQDNLKKELENLEKELDKKNLEKYYDERWKSLKERRFFYPQGTIKQKRNLEYLLRNRYIDYFNRHEHHFHLPFICLTYGTNNDGVELFQDLVKEEIIPHCFDKNSLSIKLPWPSFQCKKNRFDSLISDLGEICLGSRSFSISDLIHQLIQYEKPLIIRSFIDMNSNPSEEFQLINHWIDFWKNISLWEYTYDFDQLFFGIFINIIYSQNLRSSKSHKNDIHKDINSVKKIMIKELSYTKDHFKDLCVLPEILPLTQEDLMYWLATRLIPDFPRVEREELLEKAKKAIKVNSPGSKLPSRIQYASVFRMMINDLNN